MSVFNQSRKNVIIMVFVTMFFIIIARLFALQVLSSNYSIEADQQSKFRKVIYPDRGILFDRKRKAVLQNTTVYDLVVIPAKIKGVDTSALCEILDIDSAIFNKRIIEAIIKNTKLRPTTFEPQLSPEKMARINESMYKFSPGFYLQERSVRDYPYNAAANILGYLGEVDTGFLRRHPNDGYLSGDYIGVSGLERSYEKVLMGQRGIQYWKRDNKNRLTERLENGRYDTAAIAGKNLYTAIDIELQELGEKLMSNKIGSIVAIDPKTGGVLAMVSAPTYQPRYLTGNERRKHYSQLYRDPAKPLLNRAVNATYAPGSTFKTLQGLVGLQEGVISNTTTFGCGGAFYGCGSGKPMRCLDPGTYYLKSAITHSCNTYFANVMQRVINNSQYPNIDSSLNAWANYMSAFGLGHKLGIDIPTEKGGLIPNAKYYNKIYGEGKWNYCTFRSVSIGQGEVLATPLQVANEMAYLANKGWFITPHLVDSIEGGDTYDLLAKYKVKHTAVQIPDSMFEAVHDGMLGVTQSGTGRGARVEGINICGKTGTVENYEHGVKQKNHSFFAAFAPRENPKIAIMCIVENSGFGGTYAAPIVSYMIEKYLKDSITDKRRLAGIEDMSKKNLMPPRIARELRRLDSLDHAGDSAYLIQKGYIRIIKDTLGLEDEEQLQEDKAEQLLKEKMKAAQEKEKNKKKEPEPVKVNTEAILPDEKKKPEPKDSIR